jgi:hypothetical protein
LVRADSFALIRSRADLSAADSPLHARALRARLGRSLHARARHALARARSRSHSHAAGAHEKTIAIT